ncbi:uncharacterized protein [Atheta coriaria]|uniref:uncharacterized protein isoform X2 n=1 Tax=Dalotia coriaria TaxID=877792 RepID=UPI0031F36466
MATPTESKIVSLHEPEDDVSFSVTLGQLSVKPEVPWNEEMQALLENLHLNSIIQDLEYYIKSLRTHLNKLIDQPTWEKLPGLILSHLQTIKTKMYGKNIKLNSAISRLLEEIMSIYGTVELNVVALLSKDNDSKLSKSKQLLNCSKQILSKLKYTFYWSDVNVVHCLIKMKFDRKTTSSVSIMKYMYQNVLFNNKISKLDDLTLCGYYLLFCKYKRFISSSDHSQMLRKLFNRFDKRISYLNNFETLHEILCFDSGVTADLNTAKGRVQMITNYFKYIKDREKLDEPQDKSMINDYDKFGKDDFNTYYDCYETSSQDERTISFVDSCEMDQTETENGLNSTQDEKKIYLVESAEEFTENISTDLSTGQSSDGIKVEENIATDLSTGQSSEGIKVEENQELQEEEIQNEICDFDIDVAEVEIVTKVESVDLTESTIDLTLNEDVDECVIQMVEIRKQDNNQVDEPVEIAFSDDTKIEDQTCDHQAENHLIHQLQEYLSISKPETISLSQDVEDSIEQPINSSDDNHHNDANEESVDIEDSMLNSGQYNDTPPLYSIPGVTIHYDDAVTLDLSNKSRRNSGDGDTDQISNTDCQRNASRGKKQ